MSDKTYVGKIYSYYGDAVDKIEGKYRAVIRQKYSRQEENSFETDDYIEAVDWIWTQADLMDLVVDPEASNITLSFITSD